MTICYTVPEIWRVTDIIFFFHFGPSFAVLPPTPRPNSLKKQNLKEQNTGWYHHFTYVYQKLWSHGVQFRRYGARWADDQTDRQKKWHIEVDTNGESSRSWWEMEVTCSFTMFTPTVLVIKMSKWLILCNFRWWQQKFSHNLGKTFKWNWKILTWLWIIDLLSSRCQLLKIWDFGIFLLN